MQPGSGASVASCCGLGTERELTVARRRHQVRRATPGIERLSRTAAPAHIARAIVRGVVTLCRSSVHRPTAEDDEQNSRRALRGGVTRGGCSRRDTSMNGVPMAAIAGTQAVGHLAKDIGEVEFKHTLLATDEATVPPIFRQALRQPQRRKV